MYPVNSPCNLNTKPWIRCFIRRAALCFLVSTFLGTVGQALPGIGENINLVQGGTAILPCKLVGRRPPDIVSQISWRKEPRNVNFLTILPKTEPIFIDRHDERFEFIGNFSADNGSLKLSNITLKDEGTYTCIITLFPSGNVKTSILLNVLVPPVTSLKDDLPTVGDEEVSLVTCVAAGAKPPAEVQWLTDTLGEKARQSISVSKHADGTTTTVSSLFGVPTREIDQRSVECVVTSAALSKEERLPFTVQIYFSPVEVIISETSEGAFECVTEAKPNANIIWSRYSNLNETVLVENFNKLQQRSDQSRPQSTVKVDGATLQFPSMTSDLNGLYQCEASNLYGKKRNYVYVHVTSESCQTCCVLFGLLLVLMVVAFVAALWYLYKTRKCFRTGEEPRGKSSKVPTVSTTHEDYQQVAEEQL